jgi:hypothetical protein
LFQGGIKLRPRATTPYIDMPPSTMKFWPVVNWESSLANHSTMLAISSVVPNRPMGWRVSNPITSNIVRIVSLDLLP